VGEKQWQCIERGERGGRERERVKRWKNRWIKTNVIMESERVRWGGDRGGEREREEGETERGEGEKEVGEKGKEENWRDRGERGH